MLTEGVIMNTDELDKKMMTKVTKINEHNTIESKYLNTREIINKLFGNSKLATKVYILLVSIVQSDLKRDKKSFNDTKEKFTDIVENITNEDDRLKLGAYLKILANYGGYAYIFFNYCSNIFDENKISQIKIDVPKENIGNNVNKNENTKSNSENGSYYDNFMKKYLLATEMYNKFLNDTSYKLEELNEAFKLFKELEKEVILLKTMIDRNKYLEYALSIDEKKFDIEMLIAGLSKPINIANQKKITKKLL